MSDDEYYYESPYDDLQDIFYDADPAPELADDLAEHTAHSPVWQDDPLVELQTYFSDWEYYSDDYYDDDPKILKDNPQDGDKPIAKTEKRVRKRKLSETEERSEIEKQEEESLAKCIRGTVWAQPNPMRTTTYQQGQSGKVALKLNEGIMQSAYSTKHGFGRGRLRRDESWANELSLADMGLLTEKRKSLQAEASFEEQEGEGETEGGDDGSIMNGEIETASSVSPDFEDPSKSTSNDLPLVTGPEQSDLETAERENLGRRKRRKLQTEMEEQPVDLKAEVFPDTTNSSQAPRLDGADCDYKAKPTKGAAIPRQSSPQAGKNGETENAGESIQMTRGGRKRKLSQDSSTGTASTAASRAKRVAPSKLAMDQQKKTEKIPSTTRATRSQKKK